MLFSDYDEISRKVTIDASSIIRAGSVPLFHGIEFEQFVGRGRK